MEKSAEFAIWKGAKWYDIEIEAYKIIYDNAKDKFEDVISESESITNKSFKIISAAAIVAVFSFNQLNRYIAKYWLFPLEIILAILFISIGLILMGLLFPKEIRGRGIRPTISIPAELSNGLNTKIQDKMVYYNIISIIQENIEIMIHKNTQRAIYYGYSMRIFFITISLIMGALFVATFC